MLRIAVPRKGRALPLLQLAYDRDGLPPNKSQNQLEQDALLAVGLGHCPAACVPWCLPSAVFVGLGSIAWLQRHHLDYVVRTKKGTCVTEADGERWKLGEEGSKPGELRFTRGVR